MMELEKIGGKQKVMLDNIIMWIILMGLVTLPLFILIKIQNDIRDIRDKLDRNNHE